jgi:hypothetical protein
VGRTVRAVAARTAGPEVAQDDLGRGRALWRIGGRDGPCWRRTAAGRCGSPRLRPTVDMGARAWSPPGRQRRCANTVCRTLPARGDARHRRLHTFRGSDRTLAIPCTPCRATSRFSSRPRRSSPGTSTAGWLRTSCSGRIARWADSPWSLRSVGKGRGRAALVPALGSHRSMCRFRR